MKYKNFPQEFWDIIEKSITDELKSSKEKPVAAFDADGTLWDTDLGEGFFKWQIDNKVVNLPENPWRYYRDEKEAGNPELAYLWLAQINQGQKLSTVQAWAKQAMGQPPLFPELQKLIELLKKHSVDIYVVTASVKWAVEPGAALFGLKPEQVLGIETEVDSHGSVTNKQKGPITWRKGKPEALIAATNGRKPFLCAGNTMGDLALMESATRVRLAVGASKPGDHLWDTELKLRETAQAQNWLAHQF